MPPYTCLSVCLYDPMPPYICLSVCLYDHASLCMSMCLYVCMYVCMHGVGVRGTMKQRKIPFLMPCCDLHNTWDLYRLAQYKSYMGLVSTCTIQVVHGTCICHVATCTIHRTHEISNVRLPRSLLIQAVHSRFASLICLASRSE